jgi:hypothetical protein
LAAYAAFTPPEVRGAGSCPSAAEVAARLGPLLPWERGAADARADVVELTSAGGVTIVRLRDPDGNVVDERTTAAACDERAAEIAVLVAAWEADLHTHLAFPPPAAARAKPPTPPAAAPRATISQETKPAPAATTRTTVSLGAAVSMVAPPSQGLAPAGWVEGTWGRGATPTFRGRLSLGATGAHEIALAPGTVTWRRAAIGLGAMAGFGSARAHAALRAGALLGAIMSRGSGFDVDQSATSWQVGADAGLRGELALTPRFAIWADVGLAGFPGRQRVAVHNVAQTAALPRWEAQAGLGASFLWWQ